MTTQAASHPYVLAPRLRPAEGGAVRWRATNGAFRSGEFRRVYAGGSKGTRSEPTPQTERSRFCLADDDVLTLARRACAIEDHYSARAGQARPMDIEWAKDGVTGG